MRWPLFGLLALAPLAALAAEYEIDPAHSGAHFTVRHMMVANVRGDFAKLTGKVNWDPDNVAASSVVAAVDANSINTGEPKRDAHLKSPDFFDTAKYPTLTFRSKRVWREGGKLKLAGDLTIHGVTKEVVLEVEGPSAEIKDQRGAFRTGATATGKINRKDFGLTWNRALETGGVVVGDEVAVTIDVAMVRKAQ